MSASVVLYQKVTLGAYALRADPEVGPEAIAAADVRRQELWAAMTVDEQTTLGPWIQWVEEQYEGVLEE